MAVRIVIGEYGLAVVLDRSSRQVLSVMRRTKAGMSIKDAQQEAV
jgi:succinyl-CoA synthetase beta subunit